MIIEKEPFEDYPKPTMKRGTIRTTLILIPISLLIWFGIYKFIIWII